MTEGEAIKRIGDMAQDMRDFCNGQRHMTEKDRLDIEALGMASSALKTIGILQMIVERDNKQHSRTIKLSELKEVCGL